MILLSDGHGCGHVEVPVMDQDEAGSQDACMIRQSTRIRMGTACAVVPVDMYVCIDDSGAETYRTTCEYDNLITVCFEWYVCLVHICMPQHTSACRSTSQTSILPRSKHTHARTQVHITHTPRHARTHTHTHMSALSRRASKSSPS
eukprot:scpid46356/ scgid11538/ 